VRFHHLTRRLKSLPKFFKHSWRLPLPPQQSPTRFRVENISTARGCAQILWGHSPMVCTTSQLVIVAKIVDKVLWFHSNASSFNKARFSKSGDGMPKLLQTIARIGFILSKPKDGRFAPDERLNATGYRSRACQCFHSNAFRRSNCPTPFSSCVNLSLHRRKRWVFLRVALEGFGFRMGSVSIVRVNE